VEAGADDVSYDDGEIEITGPVESFKTLSDALRANNLNPDEGGLRMVANQEMDLSVDDTLQVLRALDNIEELDDVQNIYHNMRISDEAMAALEEE
jgi:transcriptional/translational regulatory protein YebC/TACO1